MFCYLKGGSPVFHWFMSVVVERWSSSIYLHHDEGLLPGNMKQNQKQLRLYI